MSSSAGVIGVMMQSGPQNRDKAISKDVPAVFFVLMKMILFSCEMIITNPKDRAYRMISNAMTVFGKEAACIKKLMRPLQPARWLNPAHALVWRVRGAIAGDGLGP
jgi:hypothetical protein